NASGRERQGVNGLGEDRVRRPAFMSRSKYCNTGAVLSEVKEAACLADPSAMAVTALLLMSEISDVCTVTNVDDVA
ncbi:MAG: hypothetical protein ACK53Y_25365, partial [bacterium]